MQSLLDRLVVATELNLGNILIAPGGCFNKLHSVINRKQLIVARARDGSRGYMDRRYLTTLVIWTITGYEYYDKVQAQS